MKPTRPRTGHAPTPGASTQVHLLALAASLILHSPFSILPSSAAVPLRWTVETSRVQPAVFDVVRGETIDLEAAFNSYGKPVATTNQTAFLAWQTNGMDSAWWITNAVTSGTSATARFTPAMDPGAPTVTGFIGLADATNSSPISHISSLISHISSLSYRAAFTLRFRKGPGATPNVIEQPPRILDLAHTVVINPPWPTQQGVTNAANAAITNHVTSGYLAPASALSSLASLSSLSSATQATLNEAKSYADDRKISIFSNGTESQSNAKAVWDNNGGTFKVTAVDANSGDTCVMSSDYGDYCSSMLGNGYIGVSSENQYGETDSIQLSSGACCLDGCAIQWHDYDGEYKELPLKDIASKNASDARYAPTSTAVAVASQASQLSQLSQSVTAIGAHLNAEDAHFVSTNYDSTARLPEAYVEIRMSNAWITIWQEMTRWNRFAGTNFNWETWGDFKTWSDGVANELGMKADRAWGAYDSETGGYSPEGYTQISSSNVLIAANMAYQRTVTAEGSVWILQCNQGTAHIGGDTNGFFRIKDGDGVTQFEVVKGGKREMGADATGIAVNNATTPATLTIPYSVIADDHPTVQVCADLALADWKAEDDAQCAANVSWSGASGAYVATVQAKSAAATRLFVKATYMSGGETYIHNVAPVGMDAIILNGTKYYLGTNVIDGKLVLTLSTTNPNP